MSRRVFTAVGIALLALPLIYVGWMCTLADGGEYWEFVRKNYLVFFGMPYAAFFSYFLVSFVETRKGDIDVDFFTFKFKGAAGPLVFWLLIFLAIMLGFKLFWVGH